ncbi:hypothetical protein ACWD5Q_21030 [Streptomyces sp. NPDC002513]
MDLLRYAGCVCPPFC